jgi:hypothetical protein
MSAGQYIRSFYETNAGGIARIRVQPETELANLGGEVNDAPAGPATILTTVKVSKSKREYGIGPRKVGLVFDDGQAPEGYEPGNIYYIPVMTRTVYDGFAVGDTATYLGGTADIVSKLEESIK